MHLSVFPLAAVFAAIGPGEGPVSVALVCLIRPYIVGPIRELIETVAVHVVVQPLTSVNTSITPCVRALAPHLVVGPGTFIRCLIGPLIVAVAVLLTVGVLSLEE